MQPTLQLPEQLPQEIARRLAAAVGRDMQSAQLSWKFKGYYRLRPFLPLPVRQWIQRLRNGSQQHDDGWFLPEDFLPQDNQPEAGGEHHLAGLWPDNAQYAFVLTHDVETAEGMKLIPQLAELEQDLGFRSVWNVVPHKYPVDKGLLQDLRDRGFEIGVHGFNHDGRLFWSEKTFNQRAPYINRAIADFKAVGFRAPMVHRNLEWLQRLDIQYDASCFDVDPFQPMPGGVQSIWPFVAGKFVELPYTLPQDHTLMVTLGQQSDSIWRQKLEYIRHRAGMALLITHPDYLNSPSRLNIYRSFLEHVAEQGGYWHALPREVAQWTRNQAAPLCQKEEQHLV